MAAMLSDIFSSNVKTGKLCYDLNSLSEEFMQVITQPFVNLPEKTLNPFLRNVHCIADAVRNLNT